MGPWVREIVQLQINWAFGRELEWKAQVERWVLGQSDISSCWLSGFECLVDRSAVRRTELCVSF